MSADDELVPGHPDFEKALAQGQFEFAKTRYVRTLTSGAVERLIEGTARQRDKLVDEIKNLQTVSRNRYETAVEAARAYASVLPHRVGKTWLQPPTALEKVGEFHGSDRLYKIAAKAAKDFAEAQDLLAKKHERLHALERSLRERLDSEEAAVARELGTQRGLETALQRDPLLNVAYQHLKSVANGAEMEEFAQSISDEKALSASQFPDEPL